jgi:hypothetical protein
VNQMNDRQRLEARIAQLENQIQQLQSLMQSGSSQGGFSSNPGTPGSGGGEGTPGAWLAGLIANSLTPQGPGPAEMLSGGQSQLSANSTLWCTSRFICATMSCGGSGWC